MQQHSANEFPTISLLKSLATLSAILMLAVACAPRQMAELDTSKRADAAWAADEYDNQMFRAGDGQELYVSNWPAEWQVAFRGDPRGILIALHGTNDHGGRFKDLAGFLAEHRLVTYAYDQRGYGRNESDELWPGADVLAQDLADFTNLIAQSHPGLPITLLGESLGGGVILIALANHELPTAVNRAVLVAPAVEGREAMNNFAKAGLWTVSHTVPALPVPTESGIKGLTSDEELIEAILNDPYVRKSIRVDSLWGLADLMDAAVEAAPKVDLPTLVLFGGDDTLISADSVLDVVASLQSEESEFCYYPKSGHLLLHEKLAREETDDVADVDQSDLPAEIWDVVAQWERYGSKRDIC